MTVSPMMQQYRDAKAACPEALLLFRMGDFYELFYDDAKTAASVLGLALTSRDKGDNPIPMAGFPYHQLESYLSRLIAAGHRAAICEQVEDPRQAKGLVKREVTRVVTAGTITDDALLDPRESNYLAALVPGEVTGLAWVDLSTGRFQAATCPGERLSDELARIAPVEILIAEDSDFAALNGQAGSQTTRGRTLITHRPPWCFAQHAAHEKLTSHFRTASLEGFGFDEADAPALRAAGAILDYLAETQKSGLTHIERLVPYRTGEALEMNESTRRSLELTRTIRDGRREGSLLWVLDRTVTPMGSRLLGEWLANPLTDIAAIDQRLDAVGELSADSQLADDLRDRLAKVYDVPRLLARVTTGRAAPRDLGFLARTLRTLPPLKARLAACKSERLNRLECEIDLCPEIRSQLDAALVDDCPLAAREGGIIRDGFNAQLDALRELAAGGKQWIARYQAEEAARSGIASLKVGFNKVFGYYLEVTNTHREKVPPHFQRKQTVKNAERYITPELKEYEEKVLTADEKSKDLEYELFLELREAVAAQVRRLQATAAVLAELDVLASLADLARRRNYCRPTLVKEPALAIIDGRHPVLDLTEPEGTFVPNDVFCSPAGNESKNTAEERLGDTEALDAVNGPAADHQAERQGEAGGGPILLITGPNMAGKSTYIRQVALVTIMAQMGSFVPARSAVIGIADRVFARVGASDELSRGQSTFMVEMTETARILNTATARSLVILDEIGRGTSTYDGVSLAWSVVEYLHDHVGCRTLFATHYHELTDLARSLAGIKNLNVAVREWEDDVVFLHKIVEGAADKSYGIHVARLAGVPREVLERAKEILARLEDEHLDEQGRARMAKRRRTTRTSHLQLTLFGGDDHPLLEEIKKVSLNETTPLRALELIKAWQEKLAARK